MYSVILLQKYFFASFVDTPLYFVQPQQAVIVCLLHPDAMLGTCSASSHAIPTAHSEAVGRDAEGTGKDEDSEVCFQWVIKIVRYIFIGYRDSNP